MDVAQLIEHAYQRASGGLVSMISGEQLATMRQSLFLILSTFTNKGLNLWCVATDVLPVEVGKIVYYMPQGVIDILNMQLRRGTFTAATTINAAGAVVDFAAPTRVQGVEVRLPSAGTYSLRLDLSADGVTWFPAGALAVTVVAAATVAFDPENQAASRYWRVVELVPSVVFSSCRFVTAAYEIPFSQLSRDDYTNLPDKGAPGIPLQFWYDKQYVAPRMNVWQVAQTDEMQIVLTSQKEVEDVGAMTNILAVPARWLAAIISELSVRTYLVLPKTGRTDVPLAELREIAKSDLRDAEDGEVDGGPITIGPAIGVYTR